MFYSTVPGEAILLHLGTEQYDSLDRTGTRKWELLGQNGQIADGVAQMTRAFNVGPAAVQANRARLIDARAAAQLLTVLSKFVAKMRDFKHLWHSYQSWQPAQRRLGRCALWLLPVSVLALRGLGLRRWQSCLQRWGRLAPEYTGEAAERLRCAREVMEVVQRHGLLGGNCLPRTLTLWYLLRLQGLDSQLCLGVRRVNGNFNSHAWLEYQGQPLNDAPDVRQRFATFDADMLNESLRRNS